MKRFISLFLTLILLLSLAACGNTAETGTSVPETNGEESSAGENSSPRTDEGTSQGSGSIEVEKELFDVTITLPAEMMEGTTQEDLDASVSEGVYHSATLNEDGSVTIVMSRSQHSEVMSEMASNMDETLAAMVESEDYPNFTNIETNDNYSHFIITTKSTELDLSESFSVLGFYLMGGMYGAFNGDSDIVITVDFVNADSGEIISSNSSDEMGQ